jgi:hypothetical protein
MESYPAVKKSLNAFLTNIIHDLAVQKTYVREAQTIQVEGTSYEEVSGNVSQKINLKEYQSELQLRHDDIKTLDFSLLRSKIYEAAKEQAKEMNKDLLNNLESSGLSYDVKNGSAIDGLLNLMRVYKRKGFNLDSMQIISSKELYIKFQKEMENPINREKYYREWTKLKNEKN